MKKNLIKRIEALGAEAAQLMQMKSMHEQSIRDIETRLNQIAGAITELDSLSKECADEVGIAGK
jgi:chaperonin cofactor prefoldin